MGTFSSAGSAFSSSPSGISEAAFPFADEVASPRVLASSIRRSESCRFSFFLPWHGTFSASLAATSFSATSVFSATFCARCESAAGFVSATISCSTTASFASFFMPSMSTLATRTVGAVEEGAGPSAMASCPCVLGAALEAEGAFPSSKLSNAEACGRRAGSSLCMCIAHAAIAMFCIIWFTICGAIIGSVHP